MLLLVNRWNFLARVAACDSRLCTLYQQKKTLHDIYVVYGILDAVTCSFCKVKSGFFACDKYCSNVFLCFCRLMLSKRLAVLCFMQSRCVNVQSL